MADKKKILYILTQYPQLSETYIKNEIECVPDDYALEVYGHSPADLAYRNCHSFAIGGKTPEKVLDGLRDRFKPDIVHFHYLTTAWMYFEFCRYYKLPFTIRAHSFDTLAGLKRGGHKENIEALQKYVPMINSDLCLGVLAFPFSCATLAEVGADEKKLRPAFPVVDVEKFFDTSPNGDKILNVGAALTKKKMGDFLELANRCPEQVFNLYPIGYEIADLRRENESIQGRCHVKDAVEPEEMPPIYKRHRWLVYTGDFQSRNVGWPMAVAEAQAAGVGVVMANLRPDMAEYVGEGGGYLYEDIRDVPEMIAGDVPADMRARGFELCWRSDIRKNIKDLTDIWDRA